MNARNLATRVAAALTATVAVLGLTAPAATTAPVAEVATGLEVQYDLAPAQALAATTGTAFSTVGLMTPPTGTNVFALSSKPGSARTIYLDLDGQTVSGTAWNAAATPSVAAPAWSIDADPRTFSTTERAAIYTIWWRVAQDYRGLNVNVTTAAPAAGVLERTSAADTTYGTRVLISPTTAFGSTTCGCGGKSFVGGFDFTPNTAYNTALVFTRNNLNSAPRMAEAASHEAGHTLGLQHNTSTTSTYYAGSGAWAPIMGNSYDKPVTQFSNGRFAGSTRIQDDYAIMASHGAAPVADDYTNAITTTAPAIVKGGARSGLMNSSTDVDVMSYTHAGGTVTFWAYPGGAASNLDLTMVIRNSAGAVVRAVNPATTMTSATTATGTDAKVALTLPAGKYTIAIAAGATNAVSGNYGARGTYTVRVY